MMSAAVANLIATLLATVPAGAVALGCECMAPRDVVLRAAALMLCWICLSLPIGMLIGHCTLSEEPSLSS